MFIQASTGLTPVSQRAFCPPDDMYCLLGGASLCSGRVSDCVASGIYHRGHESVSEKMLAQKVFSSFWHMEFKSINTFLVLYEFSKTKAWFKVFPEMGKGLRPGWFVAVGPSWSELVVHHHFACQGSNVQSASAWPPPPLGCAGPVTVLWEWT